MIKEYVFINEKNLIGMEALYLNQSMLKILYFLVHLQKIIKKN